MKQPPPVLHLLPVLTELIHNIPQDIDLQLTQLGRGMGPIRSREVQPCLIWNGRQPVAVANPLLPPCHLSRRVGVVGLLRDEEPVDGGRTGHPAKSQQLTPLTNPKTSRKPAAHATDQRQIESQQLTATDLKASRKPAAHATDLREMENPTTGCNWHG